MGRAEDDIGLEDIVVGCQQRIGESGRCRLVFCDAQGILLTRLGLSYCLLA